MNSKKEERKARIKKKVREIKENIYNIPNFLTLIRTILSIGLVFMVISNHGIVSIVLIFAIAAITDAADGFIARKFKSVTNFGRRFDIIADRLLMISIVLTLILFMKSHGVITSNKLALILMIMTREIISAPFFISAFFIRGARVLPHARVIGKITTIAQGITFPTVVLGWSISPILVVITSILGCVSAIYYINDSILNPDNNIQVKLDNHYEKT